MDRDELTQNIYNNLCTNSTKKIVEFFEGGFKGMYIILRMLANSSGDIYVGDISSKLRLSTARTAATLRTLESKNYVEKLESKVDKRKSLVRLTKDGRQALIEREIQIKNSLKRALNKLSNKELEQFNYLMNKILEG